MQTPAPASVEAGTAMFFAAGCHLALLIAGCLALRVIWRQRHDVPALWRDRMRRLSRSTWRGRDLIWILLPALTMLLPAEIWRSTPAWRMLLPHGAGILTAIFLWRRARHASGGVPSPMPARCAGIAHWAHIATMRFRQGVFFYLAALPMVLLAGILNHFIATLLGRTPVLQDAALELTRLPDWRARLPLIMAAVLTAPAYEELLFRGVALPAAARASGGVPAILVTSAIFAVIHWHAGTALPLFVLALFLSIAYIYTRSLTAVIVMHAMFNLVNMALLFLIADAQ